ncbi:MAG: hypothetical protein ACYTBJ_14710 [Planctomycetota bacterium]|jgi:hypothetical protein
MATQEVGNIPAGLYSATIFTKDSNGLLLGSDGTGPTSGAADGTFGIRVEGAMTVPLGEPDSEFVDVVGDDEPEVQFDFGAATSPSGVFEVTTRNPYLEAMLTNTTAYAPNADNVTNLIGAQGVELEDVAILFQHQAKTNQPGLRGSSRWESQFVPSATIRPLNQADLTQRTHTPLRLSISISKGNMLPWGETMYTGNLGSAAANIAASQNKYPMWTDIFEGDGVTTVYNLTRTPVTATGTISASPNIITFAPAPTGRVVAWYPVLKKNFTL